MKNFKTLGIVGGLIAAALVGGTLISVVSASPSGSAAANGAAADPADYAKYCDVWQKAFARALGVSVEAAQAAAKAATIATIDAAVAGGDLSAERATEIKAKIEAADLSSCRFLVHPFHLPGPKAKLGADLLNAAATALGMEPAALIEALRGGDSLQTITTDKGKNYAAVSKAVHDAAKADLDTAVAAGLDQARADEALSKLDEALAAGEFPRHGGRGHWGFRGPGHDESPDELPAS